MHILAGEFTIAKWDEQSFMETPPPAKANEAAITYKVSGDLKGELSGKYIMIYNDDTHASYNGALQFTGRIGDKAGSFFIQETGKFEGSIATTNWTIIAGSGTKDFESISGTGKYAALDRTVEFTLEVEGI